MPWYVFALVDQAPPERQGRGLAGALAARRVPGGFAIVERRADVPPVELGALERHDTVLARLAEAVPAILPVRFGTLLELEEIESTLEEREEEIAEAFNLVRDRVQFTWRAAALGPGPDVRRPRSDVRRPRSEVRRPRSDAGAPGAGTAYLQRAASAAKPAPPAAFRRVRDVLRRMVAAERYQPATPALPDSLYHLVARGDRERYGLLSAELAAASPPLRVSGPFPPFAFTPDML